MRYELNVQYRGIHREFGATVLLPVDTTEDRARLVATQLAGDEDVLFVELHELDDGRHWIRRLWSSRDDSCSADRV